MRHSALEFLRWPAPLVAKRLLGCQLERNYNGHSLRVTIVETEAYDQLDAASHSFKGSSTRNEIMFGPAGRLYVYFTYGMHYCCNVVTGNTNEGAAVLIRAVQPVEGLNSMLSLRNIDGPNLTNGPAKLCQALAIDMSLNNHDITRPPLKLNVKKPLKPNKIVQTTRIGITKATDTPWRFYIKDNPYISYPARN